MLLYLSIGTTQTFAAEFSSGTGKQTVAYMGLGNNNEDLAFAYFTNSASSQPSITFMLYGSTEYISQIKIYARPYVSTAGDNSSSLCVTDAQIWDYRNPIGKNNATLLASTTQIPAANVATVINSAVTLSSGSYMIYLTIDVKNDVALPYLSQSKKSLGGVVKSVGSTTITTSIINSGLTRVLVPERKLLYAPGDYYSKYYRIPSMAKAADGSLVAISDARKYMIHDVQNDIDILSRRSIDNGGTWNDPVTIAQGSGGSTTVKGLGYGDAALAALPNGDLLCTMINGYGLSESSATNITKNYYAISHDNGQSWRALKLIPASLYSNTRGCIAPGNMCVVKDGYLAGKVLACFRSYVTNLGAAAKGNYFLVYDPTTDSWSCLNTSSRYSVSSSDDEAHIIEVGKNQFLMSIRTADTSSKYKCRSYAAITLNSATSYTITKSGGQPSMGLTVYCNGDIRKYTDKNSNSYLIQALPVNSAVDGSSNSTRSSLTIFTQKNYVFGNQPNWTKSMDISDPVSGGREETAQYSSMTEQNDGTIGILFEEYPRVVRKTEADGVGDFYLCSWYMNLRIEDIISDAVTPDLQQLDAPTINPSSTVYLTTEHPDIVINNSNAASTTTTYYSISTITVNDGGSNSTQTTTGSFKGTSSALNWSDLKLTLTDGMVLKVIAYCMADGYKNSTVTSQQYSFTSVARNVKVVAMPINGYGRPQLIVPSVGSFSQGLTVKVPVGKTITVNAPGVSPFSFNKFTYDAAGSVLLNTKIANITTDNKDGYQISFQVPTVAATPNNGDNELVVYANYNGTFGLMSETYIYSGSNTKFNPDILNYPDVFHTLWCSDSKVSTWPTDISTSLSFGNPSVTDSKVSTNIGYPSDFYSRGFDVCVRVLPDYQTSQYLNAVLMMKKNDEFLKNDDGTYQYYLLNGCLYPYSSISTLSTGAIKSTNWYVNNTGVTQDVNKNTLPLKVQDCVFHLADKDVYTSNPIDDFEAVVYVVGSELTSVESLTQGKNYLYSISHPASVRGDLPTGVEPISNNNEDLNIYYINNNTVISTQKEMEVNIYNMLGSLIDRFNLNGSKTIDLPTGIYIANGKKFVIR